MQIVIDIPKDIYEDIMVHNRERHERRKSAYYFEGLIQNGTPLPKGHGRLVDAEILDLENLYRENNDCSFSLVCTKSEFPTIIEADKR